MFFVFYLGNLLTQENIAGVLTEVPPLISESDLHISQVRMALVRPLQLLGPESRYRELRRVRLRIRDFLSTKQCSRVNQRHFGGKTW